MEAAGLVVGAVGLAGLFSTGIELFGYFISAQNASEEITDLLCKLDLQKARLLIWGDQVGILKTEREGRNPYLDSNSAVIEASLKKIIDLLSNGQRMRDEYGAREKKQSDVQLHLQRNEISRNSMQLFAMHWSRFKSRFMARSNDGLDTKSKAVWAIWDSGKFQSLIHDLKDYIDSLNQILYVPWQVVERLLIGDALEAGMRRDMSRLQVLERASDGYASLSDQVKSIISESEAGTLDKRDEGEVLNDQSDEPNVGPGSDSTVRPETQSLSLPEGAKLFCVVTDVCRRYTAGRPCDQQTLGSAVLEPPSSDDGLDSFIQVNQTTGRRICEQINLAELTLQDSDKILEWEMTYDDDESSRPPLAQVFVYCAPCVCQIHTAYDMLYKGRGFSLVEFIIRVDPRLRSSCCKPPENALGLASLVAGLEEVKQAHPTFVDTWAWHITNFLDQQWLEQWIYAIENDELDSSQSPAEGFRCVYESVGRTLPICAGIVILGEVDDMCQIMNASPFRPQARMPRATEIYELTESKRKFLGKYIKRPVK